MWVASIMNVYCNVELKGAVHAVLFNYCKSYSDNVAAVNAYYNDYLPTINIYYSG